MKASEEELKSGRQRPPRGLVSESAALRTTWMRTSVVTTENWSGTRHFGFVIFKEDFPTNDYYCNYLLSEATGYNSKWVESRDGHQISHLSYLFRLKKKSFTVVIAQSLLRLPRNRFQLQFWFHFLEDQAELMRRTQDAMDLGDGRRWCSFT